MAKPLRKTIVGRSELENNYLKNRSQADMNGFKK